MSAATNQQPREETLLSIRLVNAKRDALAALDQISKAQGAARDEGRLELANKLVALWSQQQQITISLIQIISAPLEAE